MGQLSTEDNIPAARAVAGGRPLVVFDRGGQGQQQRPRRDLGGDGRPGCAFRIAVLVDGQVGVTADDGQAEDAGGRLVVLVVCGALGAEDDVPDHAVIVRQAHLGAHGGSGLAARHLPPRFSGRAYIHAGYASRPWAVRPYAALISLRPHRRSKSVQSWCTCRQTDHASKNLS